jgi:hypothetical protein
MTPFALPVCDFGQKKRVVFAERLKAWELLFQLT